MFLCGGKNDLMTNSVCHIVFVGTKGAEELDSVAQTESSLFSLTL